MEWFASVVNYLNGNAFAFVLLLTTLFFFLLGLKKGFISFKGKGLVLGIRQEESIIRERQAGFVHGQIDAIANIITRQHPEFDYFRTQYICKCAELEWSRSIHRNHIEDTEAYKEGRFITIKAIVQKKADADYFFSEDFESFLKSHVEEVTKGLVRIRGDYE